MEYKHHRVPLNKQGIINRDGHTAKSGIASMIEFAII